MKGLFVTGTGTNVGKTVASAALLLRYRCRAPWRYWKPIQTGAPFDDDTATVKTLGLCADDEICASGIRLPQPVSPHLAARLCGATIDVSSLLRLASEDGLRRWLIEGAGGVLVPLNQNEMMTDLMAALGLPAVIVASSQLGTINHTLLTLEALRRRSIAVAGNVLNGERNAENRCAIETYGNAAVVGEMPRFDALEPNALATWAVNELDPDGHLEQFFNGPPQC
jgi:dethiobiotin synthetase